MRFTITQPAGESTLFHPHAFDHQIGTIVPLMVDGLFVGGARLVDAVVADDRRSAALTMETVEDSERGIA
jgi:hypothetical protein